MKGQQSTRPGRMEPGDGSAMAVQCRGLVKQFGSFRAVDGVDLEIPRGACFGLLGPNGAGKTTTIEIIEGLQRATAGSVEVLGEAWGRGFGADRRLRARLGIQLQETQLGDKQTVEEVVRLFRSLHDHGRDPDDVIGLVELTTKRHAQVIRLSGGQRQRLALACALVGQPEVLFLDEPTTGLDPQARLRIWDVVRDYRTEGGTVIMTTHYMEEAAQLCEQIAIMDHGKVIARGTPAELIASLGATQIIELEIDGELPQASLEALPGVSGISERMNRWILNVSHLTEALGPVLQVLENARVELKNVATHQATLDDVFIHLTGRALRDG